MGGQGSGRSWHYDAKNTTEDHRSIDVRCLQREGMLVPGHSCTWKWLRDGEAIASIGIRAREDSIVLSYRSEEDDGEWQSMVYPVRIEWTTCNYGGQRAWFRCPVVGCGRRVALLYSGKVFACRHCYKLAYESQRESRADRMTRKAEKIRQQLGWQPGIFNFSGSVPSA